MSTISAAPPLTRGAPPSRDPRKSGQPFFSKMPKKHHLVTPSLYCLDLIVLSCNLAVVLVACFSGLLCGATD